MRIGLGLSLTQSSFPPSEGGGVEPEALWSADFENDSYSVAGSPAAYGDIIDTVDPEGFGDGGLSAGVGVTAAGSILPALAAPTIADGGSFVIVADVSGSLKILLYSEDFWSFHIQKGATVSNLTAKSEVQPIDNIVAGLHTVRMTISLGNIAVSVDGGAVETLAPAGGSAIVFNWFVINEGSSCTIKSMVCYAPVANGDLPTLPGV